MGDLIDRQAALNIPVMPKEHRKYRTYNLDDAYDDGWEDALMCVGKLPPAQPERDDCDTCKHGYFGSVECANCRVRYPSHWERREGDGA